MDKGFLCVCVLPNHNIKMVTYKLICESLAPQYFTHKGQGRLNSRWISVINVDCNWITCKLEMYWLLLIWSCMCSYLKFWCRDQDMSNIFTPLWNLLQIYVNKLRIMGESFVANKIYFPNHIKLYKQKKSRLR